MNKALRAKIVDMLLDQKFRNEAVGIIAELVKTHPSAVVAAYEKVMDPGNRTELINGVDYTLEELTRLHDMHREVVLLMRDNQKVSAVKALRMTHGYSLRDAVQIVNYSQQWAGVNWLQNGTLETIDREIAAVAREIAAVIQKFY